MPRDSKEFITVNKFLYLLLDKKVNRRVCNFNKLRQTEFYENFPWDDLINFRMKAPYVPKSTDFSEELKTEETLYERINENSTKVYLSIFFYSKFFRMKENIVKMKKMMMKIHSMIGLKNFNLI